MKTKDQLKTILLELMDCIDVMDDATINQIRNIREQLIQDDLEPVETNPMEQIGELWRSAMADAAATEIGSLGDYLTVPRVRKGL